MPLATPPPLRHAFASALAVLVLLATASAPLAQGFPKIALPGGFQIEKMADSLQLPSALAWDDQGRMYVGTAGGGLFPEQLAPIQILRVDPDGSTEVVVDLSDRIEPALVGLLWHDDAFYITHRADDLTGAVSRVTMDGELTTLFSGIIDSQAEHQINDIRMGPNGRMYVAVGPAGNAGIVGPTVAPYIALSPGLKATPCEDVVLTGRNRLYPDFRTPAMGDSVLTGAYVPFGTMTTPGQVIEGVEKCGGSILSFDPDDAENTIRTEAWGFRNLIGLAFDSTSGTNAGNMLYAAENGYDIRERGVRDTMDASLRVTLRVSDIGDIPWYGVPDFTAGRLPVTDPQFQPPDSLQAPVFVGDQRVAKGLGFLIDHAASGLTPPTPNVVLGRHPFNSSPSMIDVAPASWGDLAGHVFVAEWGDLAPPTNPLRGPAPAGFRVVRVDPATGEVFPFVRNQRPGPASGQPPVGEDGIERPFDVQFGPDGAMYIVDYGEVMIDYTEAPPYQYQTDTGSIWRVTAAGGAQTTFTVTVENVSTPGLLSTDRAMGAVPLSPGAWVTFRGDDPAFTPGEMADSGTRLIAEDGFPSPDLSPPNTDGTETTLLMQAANASQVGTFSSDGGADNGPAIFPALGGAAAESATFTFTASEGDRLQIETMFVQSNDWFLAFGDGGLELFEDGEPVSGDVTDRLRLYDAGTEIDAPPGEGPTSPPGAVQKPVQDPMATNVGTDESEPIQLARDRHSGFSIPANAEVIRVTITPSGATAISGDRGPGRFELEAARPNPFTGSTEVRFTVPEAGPVRLAVYDVLGRQVAVLVDETLRAGPHGVRFDGKGLPSGTYVVRAQVGDASRTRLMTLVR
ncbi:spondin domain-containing protein [Rubrivirga sp.]|uniref:spondin domain-containing protein n=1 Tax=Rubrivirga sp. TaxID=1885344 RepID=UPI003B529F5F